MNAGEDVSDGAFSAPGSPPQAVILSPKEGATAQMGKLVILEGFGLDPDEGTIRGDALRWTSDRDGFLGAGDELLLHDLSPGQHRLTLEVTDGDGMKAASSVIISITDDSNRLLYLPVIVR
ncbi:MAG: hypothetical protein GXP42_13075 [Chloroflexi bacterium]|nr:hypothetical protein [Chloroflexota bacterium]